MEYVRYFCCRCKEPKETDYGYELLSLDSEEPWSLSCDKLDEWFDANLKEGTESCEAFRKAALTVYEDIGWMYTRGWIPYKCDKFILGGSVGKRTMLSDHSDVDLVVFISTDHLKPISSYPSPKDYTAKLKQVIDGFARAMESVGMEVIRCDDFLVCFETKVGQKIMRVDLLPTASNGEREKVYREMFQLTKLAKSTAEYSASLVEYQRKFVANKPEAVRELICLVKHWACTKLPEELQKSYPLELITIHHWEEAGGPADFSKAQGLKAVLCALANLKKERKYWKDYYGKDLALKSMKSQGMKNPLVLDPANPMNNVCAVYHRRDNMQRIEQVAEETLRTPLLKNVRIRSKWRRDISYA
ncbi:2'-5'-oligoadenylate synthase 2-like [Acanthaster planci]|uniref:2'-5'-oligoadenylate synthase 2-like n=1 Tax=Acanthaster planci TaxID=133434 RepID=A0A8B7YUH7_ACAPL|nr:2'-5'-oligoadenylate synthase 2-like [Acanthaster planci]